MSALSSRKSFFWGAGALAVMVPAAAIYFFMGMGRISVPVALAEKIAIAALIYPGTAPIYIAKEKGFFQQEGLDVTFEPVGSGKDGLTAVIENKADFTIASEIPLALAAMKGEKIAIVATLFSGEKDHGVIARKDRGIAVPADLKGKRIAMTPGTTSQFLLDLLLTDGGLSRGDVHLVNLNPEQMPAAWAKGELDAASTWHPTLQKLQQDLGQNGLTFDGRGLFSLTVNLTGRQDFVKARPEAVSRTLRALIKAVEFIKANPQESRKITAASLNMDEALLGKLWDGYRFDVRLDQSFLIALEDTSRWAIRNGFTDATSVPNYSAFIFPNELRRLNPVAVSFIR